MRRLLPALTATLMLVSCSDGRDTQAYGPGDRTGTERDLSLGASQAAAEPLVLSAVERRSMARPASERQRQVRLLATVRTAVPRPTGSETTSAGLDLAPAPAAEVMPEAPATPPVEVAVAQRGAGHSLAPGQTVSSIPAVAMGSGDVPSVQGIARGHSGGVVVRAPDPSCTPHGGVIAINRVFPDQPGWRRF